jgi:hypothetical protein
MSRNPSRSKRPEQTSSDATKKAQPNDDAVIEQAHALYGSEAATAIAFCGLDAWFEGEEEEFRRLAGVFRRLRN